MAEREYFTKREAAEYLRLSVPTVDRLRLSGALAYIKVGKKVLFRKRDLDRFMAARVVKK